MTDAEFLANRSHPQPHSYLGAHASGDRSSSACSARRRRGFPRCSTTAAAVLKQTHPAGVFEAEIEGRKLPLRYRLDLTSIASGTLPIDDPYRFLPTLGELDLHLVGEGRHEALWEGVGCGNAIAPPPSTRAGREPAVP
jgi:1,4-alpha-glucan branching enzyme